MSGQSNSNTTAARARLRSRLAVALALVLTAGSLATLFLGPGLMIDPSVEAVIGDLAAEQDGTPQLVAVLRPRQPVDAADIADLARVTRAVAKLPAVRGAVSAATAAFPAQVNGDIEMASLAQRLQQHQGAAPRLLEIARAEPMLAGRLFGVDGQSLALLVDMRPQAPDALAKGAQSVETLLRNDTALTDAFELFVTGTPLVTSRVGGQLINGLKRVAVLIVLVVAGVLLACFTGWRVLALSAASMVLGLLWTLAAMSALGFSMNLVTALVPPFVVTLTLAYGMHALFAVLGRPDPVAAASQLVLPMSVTAVTTVAGLLALAMQALPVVREFAVSASIGVLAGMLSVASVLVPGLLACANQCQPRPQLTRLIRRLSHWAGRRVIGSRRLIVGVAIAVLLLGGLSATQVQPGARYVGDLGASHPVRVQFEAVNEALGGANGFEVLIESTGANAVLQPEILAAIDALETWLEAQPEVGGVSSALDVIKRLNQAFAESEFALPDSVALTKQLLLVGAPPDLNRYLNLDYSTTRLLVRTPHDDTVTLAGLFERTRARLEQLPPGISVSLRGDAVVLTHAVSRLTAGQFWSFLVAFAAIFVVLSLVFASVQMGLRAMLPNLVPVVSYFGLIGLLDIPLGPATALTACIVLGIAVDDTLFYLVRFNRAARALASEERAAMRALRDTLRPVTVTSITLVLGFLCMTATGFASHAQFGALAAATLGIAWLCDLLLTPAISARSSIVTLWDVLRIDLGAAPEKTIPLMDGMSRRQARLFALLAHTVNVRAGQTLIHAGETGREMYVLIDGEVRVWVNGDGGDEIEIVRLRRGATIGETGLFFEKRTASVTAVSDARLLAVDADTLERIRQRYPRIAALIFRNLNRVQAATVARSTQRLVAEH